MTGYQLSTFPREEFLSRRWRYRPGEHVTIIGPTGSGKTYLGWQLLERTASREMPAIVMMKKPRDYTTARFAAKLHFRTVRDWPPLYSIWKDNDPPGWVVWPRTRFDDVRADRARKSFIFRKVMAAAYRGGGIFRKRPRILIVDDAYGLIHLLDLEDEAIETWTEARSMGEGFWSFFQKPSHVPLWAYSQAAHLFLFNDPDKRSRERFAEIGGVDPETVRDTVMSLDRHQALYIRRDGPRMCIVDV